MQHAIARQAEAERERRAKIINAEGEFQAAAKLADAADVIGRNPTTLQLRYLQTLREIGANQNSTIVFPIDLVKPALDVIRAVAAEANGEIAPGSAPGGVASASWEQASWEQASWGQASRQPVRELIASPSSATTPLRTFSVRWCRPAAAARR